MSKHNTRDRYDIGVWVAQDGGNALTGACSVSNFPVSPTPPWTNLDLLPGTCSGRPTLGCSTVGSSNNSTCWDTSGGNQTACDVDPDEPPSTTQKTCSNARTVNCSNPDGSNANVNLCNFGTCLDQPFIGDTCGDITQSNNPLYSSIQNIKVACVDTNGDGNLDINTCLSWRQSGANDLCTSPVQAFPGAPSKCSCTTLPGIAIAVPGVIKVDKVTNPANDPQSFNFTLTGGPTPVNTPFSLTDASAPFNSGGLATGAQPYVVAETVPDGWTQTTATCTSDQAGRTQTPGNIVLRNGETVTCTFTNTKNPPTTGSLKITKTVDAGGSGFTSGSFGVQAVCTNPSNTYNATIDYPTPGFVTITGIPSGSNCTVTETSKPAAPAGYSWDAETITGSPATITGGGTANVTVANKLTLIPIKSLAIVKTATPATYSAVGDVISYSYLVTNSGNVTLAGPVTVADDKATVTCPAGGLAPLASMTCTASYTIIPGDITAGTVTNTAYAKSDETQSLPDSETVTFVNIPPDLSVTKTANPTSVPETGGSVTFTFAVINNASEAATITSLSDSKFGTLTGDTDCQVGATLAANGGSCSFTATFPVPASDLLGSHANTFTAVATDPEGFADTATADATVTYTNVPPTVTLDKSVDVEFLDEPGGDFTFTLLVTNTSAEAVTITALTDSQSGAAIDFSACTALIGTTLAAGASAPCSYVVSHTDVAKGGGGYDNTASVTVTDNDGSTATATDTQSVWVDDLRPTVKIEKLVDNTTLPEPGNFNFTLRITNTSVEPIVITQLTDWNVSAMVLHPYLGTWLQPGEVLAIPYTVSHTDPMSYRNDASVTVQDNEENYGTATATKTVYVTDVLPTVTLVKSVDVPTMPEPGGVFNFTLTITNNSVEDVIISDLTDTQMYESSDFSECWSLVGYDGYSFYSGYPIPPGEAVTCTYAVKHLEAGSYDNTASVTVLDNEYNSAEASHSQTVTVTNVAPDISVTKTANPTAIPETGGSVDFTYVVTNNSSFEAATITVLSDDKFGALAGDADCKVGTVLAGGASCTFAATFTVPAGDYPGSHVNVFTATAKDNENTTATATANATVIFTDVLPDIVVTKTANPTAVPETGGNVVFTFRVTNNSAEAAIISSLSDSVYGTLTGDTDCNVGTTVVDYCEFSITRFVSGDSSGAAHHNVFTGKATDNDGNEDTATDDATVTFTNVPPTVTLDKSVDVEFLDEPGGDFTFTLLVTNTSAEAVTITALTDSQSGAAIDFSACTALIGTTLAAGASAPCSYVVSHTDVAKGGGGYDNTASVTVTDNDGSTATATDTQSVWVDDLRPTVKIEKLVDNTTLPEPRQLQLHAQDHQHERGADRDHPAHRLERVGHGPAPVPRHLAAARRSSRRSRTP